MDKSYTYFVSYQFNVADGTISGFGHTTVGLTQKINKSNIADAFDIIHDNIAKSVSKNRHVGIDQVSVVVINFILIE